jgi:hypothetical protein
MFYQYARLCTEERQEKGFPRGDEETRRRYEGCREMKLELGVEGMRIRLQIAHPISLFLAFFLLPGVSGTSRGKPFFLPL